MTAVITPRARRRVAAELEPSTDWRDEAACRDADPELFHPSAFEAPGARDARVDAAKRVCAGCPVRAACLTEALLTEPASRRFGIWGGTLPDERADDSDHPDVTRAREEIASVVGGDWRVETFCADYAAVLAVVEEGQDPGLLSKYDRLTAVALCMVRGWTYSDTCDRLGMSWDAVDKAWQRAKQRAQERGEPVPQRPLWMRGTNGPGWATAA